MPPPGQRDYASIKISRHAVERFVERFEVAPERAEEALREALRRTRRMGRNASNGAVAVVALHEHRVVVAIIQESTCLTVLTWNQFKPKLAEFGRPKLPRKWGRTLRRLVDPPEE